MAKFRFEIQGLDDLMKRVHDGANNTHKEVVNAMRDSVQTVMVEARALVRYKTGLLRRSIQSDVQNSGFTGIVYQDTNMAPYGPGIEFGTAPHTIAARYKRVLADRKAGIIFGRVVNHPGNKPFPFMSPALENKKQYIIDRFHQLTDKIVSRMAGK